MTDTVNEPRNAGDSCAVAVPVTAKEFGRWSWDKTVAEDWPDTLIELSHRAFLTLKSMDQPAFAKSEVLQRESVKDLQAFATAYAAWKSTVVHTQQEGLPAA